MDIAAQLYLNLRQSLTLRKDGLLHGVDEVAKYVFPGYVNIIRNNLPLLEHYMGSSAAQC